MEIKTKRTAREIKVSNDLMDNKNINVKIGTVENREAPETVYIFISFWAKPTSELSDEPQSYLKEVLNNKLGSIYRNQLKPMLKSSEYFTSEKDNIFLKNIPENINYNDKRNFISLELYLHTLNVDNDRKIPLSNKKNTELFNETLDIANIIGNSDILSEGEDFEIFKKSMG